MSTTFKPITKKNVLDCIKASTIPPKKSVSIAHLQGAFLCTESRHEYRLKEILYRLEKDNQIEIVKWKSLNVEVLGEKGCKALGIAIEEDYVVYIGG